MEQRIYTVEDRVAGLRERVASLEAGQTYSRIAIDQQMQRDEERADMFDAALAEIRRENAMLSQRLTQNFHDVNTSLSALKAGMDTHTQSATDRKEVLRYYRSILVPTFAGLMVWLITGNQELVKLLLGK